MIFRLLAIENRVPNYFLGLLVDFLQFLGSQNGLIFDLKMALKSIFCSKGDSDSIFRLPRAFWSLFGLDFLPISDAFQHDFRPLFTKPQKAAKRGSRSPRQPQDRPKRRQESQLSTKRLPKKRWSAVLAKP